MSDDGVKISTLGSTYYTAINTGWTWGFQTSAAASLYGLRVGANSNNVLIQGAENTGAVTLNLQPFGGNILLGATSSGTAKVGINVSPSTTLHVYETGGNVPTITVGSTSAGQVLQIAHTEGGATTSSISNTYNNSGAVMDFRMTGNTSAETVIRLNGSKRVLIRSLTDHGEDFQMTGTSWFSGTVTHNGNILENTDDAHTIGSSASAFQYVYTRRLSSPSGANLNLYASADIIANVGSSGYFQAIGGTSWIRLYADEMAIRFGGTTSSFPMIKRSGAGLQVRLADDVALSSLETSSVYAISGSNSIEVSPTAVSVTQGSYVGILSPTTLTASQSYYLPNASGTLTVTLSGSLTWDAPSIAPGTSASTTFTVTGATAGDVVTIGLPAVGSMEYIISTAHVSAANTVTITLYNSHSSSIDFASSNFKIKILK
jgi:hypothetical protein